jgi:hypothetical protein
MKRNAYKKRVVDCVHNNPVNKIAPMLTDLYVGYYHTHTNRKFLFDFWYTMNESINVQNIENIIINYLEKQGEKLP